MYVCMCVCEGCLPAMCFSGVDQHRARLASQPSKEEASSVHHHMTLLLSLSLPRSHAHVCVCARACVSARKNVSTSIFGLSYVLNYKMHPFRDLWNFVELNYSLSDLLLLLLLLFTKFFDY